MCCIDYFANTKSGGLCVALITVQTPASPVFSCVALITVQSPAKSHEEDRVFMFGLSWFIHKKHNSNYRTISGVKTVCLQHSPLSMIIHTPTPTLFTHQVMSCMPPSPSHVTHSSHSLLKNKTSGVRTTHPAPSHITFCTSQVTPPTNPLPLHASRPACLHDPVPLLKTHLLQTRCSNQSSKMWGRIHSGWSTSPKNFGCWTSIGTVTIASTMVPGLWRNARPGGTQSNSVCSGQPNWVLWMCAASNTIFSWANNHVLWWRKGCVRWQVWGTVCVQSTVVWCIENKVQNDI